MTWNTLLCPFPYADRNLGTRKDREKSEFYNKKCLFVTNIVFRNVSLLDLTTVGNEFLEPETLKNNF